MSGYEHSAPDVSEREALAVRRVPAGLGEMAEQWALDAQIEAAVAQPQGNVVGVGE